MTNSTLSVTARRPLAPPSTAVTVIGVLVALWSLGFAAVNIGFEFTGHFAHGEFARYSAGISVMSWLVVVLKVFGAAVALLTIARRPVPLSSWTLSVLAWGGFAVLGIYALGSLVQAVGMAAGVAGLSGELDAAGVAYVLFFLCGAVAFGVLALSYARRAGTGWSAVILGVAGAPALLAGVLLGAPAVLIALGVMPAY